MEKKVSPPAAPWNDTQILASAKKVLEIEVEGIEKVRAELGTPFCQLVRLCLDTLGRGGKLVLTGIGKSGHIGRKVSATLASTGAASVFLYPVEAMHGDLGMLVAGDLLIALSYSGETDELLAVLPAAKRLGVPIVAITGVADSRLAKWCELTVPMPVPREACPFNLAPTTTTTALLALGDALAITLLKARGFSKEQYALLHPAGAIGRSITLRITDVMRTGDRFPRVSPKTKVHDTLVAMTKGRAGSVAVIGPKGKLLGIFTDGDFRRRIVAHPNLLELPVSQVMTRNPITLRDDAMAIEVMGVLEERKIDDLIVVDAAGRAVGLIDIQDLPRFKLM
ncbi:MAG: KpsF/GutQ family sugar-phosphate isomerase [Lentisphaeria bacterium]|jgi:arabinose-5-phosphate isomerase